MASPVRRVLGTKDANAPLNMRSPSKSHAVDTVRSPSPSTNPGGERTASPLSSPREALKRKIDQVEDPERIDQEQPLFLSQQTELLSQHSSHEGDDESAVGSPANDSSNVFDSTASFSATQDAAQTQDQQFELQQEEMSQRTLDNLHAVPMPQNSSQLPPLAPALLPEVSAGLSSFLDFEAHASSQNSDGVAESHVLQNEGSDDRKDADSSGSNEETRRKKVMDEKAAELRTRLQLALYKVQTNQAARPFSRLKKVDAERRSASPHHSQTSDTTPRLTNSSTLVPTSANTSMATQYNDTAEHEIYTRRAEATSYIRPAVRSLDALPQPHIVPTAYSSRWTQLQRNDSDGQLPSSPPLSRSPSASSCKIDPALTDLDPQLPKQQPVPQRYDQLSSPPVSPNKLRTENRRGRANPDMERAVFKTPAAKGLEAGPTSSTIKGEAANVLLQLTRGGPGLSDI